MTTSAFDAFCAPPNETSKPDVAVQELNSVFRVVIAVLSVIGITGNILNLFTLRSASLQTVPFRYIKALAVFDLIALFLIMCHAFIYATDAFRIKPIALYAIYFEHVAINSFLVAGLYCALFLTVERYMLISRPHQKRIFNIDAVFPKVMTLLGLSFLLHFPMILQNTSKEENGVLRKGNNQGLLCGEPTWTIYSYYGYTRESIRFLCVFVLVALNFFITKELQIAKKNRRLLTKRSSTVETLEHCRSNSIMKSFTEKRLTALMIAICVIYVVGNVPMIVVMMFQNETTEAMYPFQVFRFAANTLEVLNHCSNFFIFCMASSEYTRAFLTSCPCLRQIVEDIPYGQSFLSRRRYPSTDFSDGRYVAIGRNTARTNSQRKRTTSSTSAFLVPSQSTATLSTLSPRGSIRRKSTLSGTGGLLSVGPMIVSPTPVRTTRMTSPLPSAAHCQQGVPFTCLVIENESATIFLSGEEGFREGDDFI